MFDPVPTNPELASGEHEILKFWEKTQAFEKLRAQNRGGPKWSFLDGPITANNPMGVHHAWGRTYKDVFQRYFAMRGYDQRWQNGFDCQGLWVEVQVERELGFNSKRDIEEYGLEEFVQRCKERVLKYAGVITEQSVRLGMWMDWENSYFTMSDENNYTIWSFLKKCHSRRFIYKGLDSMPWCPRCGTGISEQERKEGYKEVEDEAVYLKFPLIEREGEFLLVWTTTPWTLAANVAAAVHPDLSYVRVRQGQEVYVLAETRMSVLESLSKSKGQPEILERLKGRDLVGLQFAGPFDELPAASAATTHHRIIPFDEVTETEGTGIVHIAPGCGKEDFDLSRKEDLPVIAPIDEFGNYTEGFGFLTGKFAGDVAPEVYESLRAKDLFYKQERYRHDYPHCWRCQTPLLFRAVDEWYIDMSWRDEIKDIVGRIRWIPEHGESQEIDWLNNMGDWMISKKRYWGLALPIWECSACGWFDVIGGRDELRERAVKGWEGFEGNSPHRPWVDAVKIRCESCGEEASRITDVGNPWLDAGIVPYSTVGYNSNRELWSEWIPADFVVESFPGQFRNWFYAMLAMSTMMEAIPPFKTLLGHALVKDEKGEEFSKSRYFIEFNEAADKASADVMRWVYCKATPTNNLSFGYPLLDQTRRKVFGTLWNTYLFFTNYAILDEFDPTTPAIPLSSRPEIDRWILSDLQELVETANRHLSDYWLGPFVRKAEEFIDELSNWYIRRNRRRFWDPRGKNPADKLAAYQTLHEVLLTLTKLLAPVVPFMAERIYQNLAGPLENAPESVHLCSYPEIDQAAVDRKLSYEMSVIQQATGNAHAIREKAGFRVRQPLPRMHVATSSEPKRAALGRLKDLLAEELNIKEVVISEDLGDLVTQSAKANFGALGPRYGKDVQAIARAVSEMDSAAVARVRSGETWTLEVEGKQFEIGPQDLVVHVETHEGWETTEAGDVQIAIDTRLTPALIREGLARDVVRHLQQLRSDTGLNIEDRIRARWETEDADLTEAISEWSAYIAGETQADALEAADLSSGASDVSISGRTLKLAIEKV